MPIGTVGDVQTGNTPSKKNADFWGGEYPFFKPSDLSQGESLIHPSETLSSKGVKKSRVGKKGSVLVNSIGNIGTIGLLQVDGSFNQQIHGISPFSFMDSRFLYWLLQSQYVQEQMIEKSSATTIPILNKSKFNTIIVRFPDLTSQKKIATKINKVLHSILLLSE